MTGDGIADLRAYVQGLRTGGGQADNSLATSIRRFTAKFAEVTGIAVEVEAAADLRCSDRLAAEVFQMVEEGLSNIRRHTPAEHTRVDLQRRGDHLVLHVANADAPGAPAPSFTPRSITERAAALGGQARIERMDGTTAVVVEIPL